jgi:hypothetical protein
LGIATLLVWIAPLLMKAYRSKGARLGGAAE